jgi:osmotically-inducible protein OsmY
VQNGNVTLYGVVDSQMDKNVAGIRANSVPGIFKVTNDLTVAGKAEKN